MIEEGDRMHLIIDAQSANQRLMRQELLLRRWLLKTAKVAEMTVYGEPQVIDFPWPGAKGTALSGVCFLGESSITVHTYPEVPFIFIDIFSCKDFDVERILAHVRKTFKTQQEKVLLIARGICNGTQIIDTKLVFEHRMKSRK